MHDDQNSALPLPSTEEGRHGKHSKKRRLGSGTIRLRQTAGRMLRVRQWTSVDNGQVWRGRTITLGRNEGSRLTPVFEDGTHTP